MQYQRTLSSSSMAPSERSISSGSSGSPPQNLVALPSMTHSLAALPTMSSLPHDMMHYNAAAHSRARVGFFHAHVFARSLLLSDGVRTPETKATRTRRCAQRESHICVGGSGSSYAEHLLKGIRRATLAQSSTGRGFPYHCSKTAKRKTDQRESGRLLDLARSDVIHFAVGLVTRSQMNALLQPGYHIRAERNSSVVEDM